MPDMDVFTELSRWQPRRGQVKADEAELMVRASWAGLSYAEIARRMGRNKDTVMKEVRKAEEEAAREVSENLGRERGRQLTAIRELMRTAVQGMQRAVQDEDEQAAAKWAGEYRLLLAQAAKISGTEAAAKLDVDAKLEGELAVGPVEIVLATDDPDGVSGDDIDEEQGDAP